MTDTDSRRQLLCGILRSSTKFDSYLYLGMSVHHVEQLSAVVYEIRDTGDRGIGVFARTRIECGTRIIAEKPIIRVPPARDVPDGMKVVADHVTSSLCTLTETQRSEYFKLTNNHHEVPIHLGIAITNGLPIGPYDGAVFLICSRFNHSCTQNAAFVWDTKTEQENVFALRDIEEGKEITVGYLDDTTWRLPRDERRAAIREQFNFLCQCHTCAHMKNKLVERSDKRRQRLAELDRALQDGVTIRQDPEKAMSYCKEMLDILRLFGEAELRLRATVVYYDASQICAVHGNFEASTLFAKRAVENKREWQGEHMIINEKILEKVEQPRKHAGARWSQRWADDDEIFKVVCHGDISEEKKEKWLWGWYTAPLAELKLNGEDRQKDKKKNKKAKDRNPMCQ